MVNTTTGRLPRTQGQRNRCTNYQDSRADTGRMSSVSKLRGLQLRKEVVSVLKDYSHWSELAAPTGGKTSSSPGELVTASSLPNRIIHSPSMIALSTSPSCPSTITKRSKKAYNRAHGEYDDLMFDIEKFSRLSLDCTDSQENNNEHTDNNGADDSSDDYNFTYKKNDSIYLSDNDDNDDMADDVDTHVSSTYIDADEDAEWDENQGIISYEPPKKPIKVCNTDEVYCIPISSVSTPARKPLHAITPTSTTNKSFGPAKREALVKDMYKKYNEIAFNGKLPDNLGIIWSKRLLTTAGITRNKTLASGDRSSTIELSIKVVVDEQRLASTLLHEMCHVASWLVDGERKPPHGPSFWKWARVCENSITGSQVTTCHSYDIHKPYKFKCANESCQIMYSRHSKKGIDINRHRCGQCKSRLEYMGNFTSDGKLKQVRECNGFSKYVKEHFSAMKKQLSKEYRNISTSDIMKRLGVEYQSQKVSSLEEVENKQMNYI